MVEHEERIEKMEERMSTVKDTAMLHHRAQDLSAKCDDLQNRLRRNNLRIFQIPEGSEGRDTVGFVK